MHCIKNIQYYETILDRIIWIPVASKKMGGESNRSVLLAKLQKSSKFTFIADP